MKIQFISENFPPESNAAASRVYERACYWVKWGHQVTVITSAPNFPEGQLFTGYDVMQRQKKIANIETLDDPSSVKAYKELSVDAQKLCRQNSSNCTTRALATSGKENTDFIPFEQGEDMKLFAEENGTTFSEFAASLEILPKLG